MPESVSVKNRLHLDVHVAAVAELVDRGARVLDTSHPWTVLADPEGNELCAFVRAPAKLPAYRLYELVLDSVEPELVARWWADRFGIRPEGDGEVWSVGPGAGLPWELVFVAVPEPKTVKNRVHVDVWGSTDELVTAGARLLRARGGDIGWNVLADPEGNEFCAFTPG